MKSVFFVLFLSISVSVRMSFVDSVSLTPNAYNSDIQPYLDFIENLKRELASSTELQRIIPSMTGIINNLGIEFSVVKQKVADQEKKIIYKDNLINSMAANIYNLSSQFENAQGQINDKDNLIQIMVKKVVDQEKIIKNIDNMINSMTENIKKLNSQLDIAEGQIKNKDEIIKLKNKNIDNINSQVTNLSAQNKNQNNLIQINVNKIADQEKQIKNKDEIIKLIYKDIDKISSQVKNLSDQNKNKDNLIQLNVNKIAEQEKQIKNKDKKINGMTENIKNCSSQLAMAEGQIKNRDDIINLKNLNIDYISAQAKNLSALISIAYDQINSPNDMIKSDLEKITKIIEVLLMLSGTESCPIGQKNDIYKMKVPGLLSFKAPCISSGWMVIQRRQDGSVDFARKWNDYRAGFGSLTGEFFIGLEKIHQMTKNVKHELFIWLGMHDGSRSYARYDDFKIGSNDEFYKLISVGEYSGKAGDSLVDSVGSRFSTVDNFNLDDCETQNTGGWWYPDCDFQSALNGLYYNDGEAMPFTGIQWTTWNGNLSKSIAFTEIMIKPK